MRQVLLVPLLLAFGPTAIAQPDTMMLEPDTFSVALTEATDEGTVIDAYDVFNTTLGGDSVRQCNGMGCTGWVEDHYPDGRLKHRGYYEGGRLLVFKNYHPNGQLEREFKAKDMTHSVLNTFHLSGTPRTETQFTGGRALAYTEHYADGRIRYQEERHKSEPYYLLMDLYAPNGTPISTLHLVDKKHVVFEQKEYWPNGSVRSAGQAQYDPHRYDTRRIGSWVYYDESGKPEREERYLDGKVHEVADLH